MMKYFETLGRLIESEWSKVNFDSVALPPIATDALTMMLPSDHVSAEEILSWVMTGTHFVPQTNLDSDFAQPSITVYSHPMFYIEALYWVTGTTSVHQHSFSGAFSVLEGASLQSLHQFTLARRVNAHMLIGDLELQDVRLLTKGAVEPIVGGARLIHSVFHLPAPSVTIVVRTVADIEHLPQYTYLYPHVAINPFYKDALLKRRRQVLELLSKVYPSQYEAMAIAALRRSDLLTTHLILTEALAVLRMSDAYTRVADAARERHGDVVDKLIAVAEEAERRAFIVSCRNGITDRDGRFFLALLLNIPARDWILKVLQQRYPTMDGRRKAIELSTAVAKSMFGVDFDDLDQRVFGCLLEGRSIEEIVSLLEAEYGASQMAVQRQVLVDFCVNLRRTAFKPLLVESPVLAS